jgi:uroporphyrinogen III methyltransferase/synthase
MTNKVYLVGGGPGDPGLITLKGIEAIKNADVIVYDRLINNELLAYGKENCELIYAGKKANKHHLKQEEINEVLISKAKEKKNVVRLKGGDPYVFGRGGEEGIALAEESIPFEVIPGITSAIAGLNYAGIPITHRGVATSFHVMTGHFKKNSEESLDFESIAKLNGTIVFLMGIGNLDQITKGLIQKNMDKKTPVAVIQWATYSEQKSVVGTLETIGAIVKEQKVKTPGIIVIGDVINYRDELNYFENLPLFNKNIGITRPKKQNSSLVKEIRGLGGKPIELPTIKVEKINQLALETAIEKLSDYSWLIFTSVNAVEIFFEKLDEMALDVRALGPMKVAVVGNSTKNKLRDYGIKADLIPKEYTGQSLGKLLVKELNPSAKILIPRSIKGKKKMIKILEEKAIIDDLPIYDLIQSEIDNQLLDRSLDYITFTSPSTFYNFSNQVKRSYLENTKIISIGPITSKAIRNEGFKVYREAINYTIDGLVESLRSKNDDTY